MIGYRITRRQLEALIEKTSRGWLDQAKKRTDQFREQGFYAESSSTWSKVKPVYMLLQGNCKCAFCEQKLESVDFGKVAQDVEHFRPKGNIREWKLPKALQAEGVSVTGVPDAGSGYYLLPYHPFNYSAACKPCNSVLKKDYFPIAGKYNLKGDDPANLLNEKPYLIYPIGDFDDDPEHLISFYGVSPRPVAKSGHKRKRALVTIEFFNLDNESKRKNLFRDRATVIVALFPQLEKLAAGAKGKEKREAQELVDGFTSANSMHANCARSYRRTFETDPAEARALFEAAVRFISSTS